MKNSEAVKLIEDSLDADGIYVMRVGGSTPAKFEQDDHRDIPEGIYRVVDITVVVPDSEQSSNARNENAD